MPLKFGGRFFNVFGHSSDGFVYGPAAKQSAQGVLNAHNAAMVSIRTGKATYISDGSTRAEPAQFNGMAVTRRWAVWAETTSADMSTSDWRMYSYDRDSGQERLLAKPPDVGFSPAPLALGDTIPVLDRNMVYFAAVSSIRADGEPVTSIYSVPIDGSAPSSKLIDDASNPSVFSAGHVLTYAKGNSLWRRDLSRGTAKRVHGFSINKACGWSQSAEGTLVLCSLVRKPGKASTQYSVTVVTADGRRVKLPAFKRAPSSFAATSRWAAFNVRDPKTRKRVVYVYDVKKKRLAKLPTRTTFGTIQGHAASISVKTASDGVHLDRLEVFTLL